MPESFKNDERHQSRESLSHATLLDASEPGFLRGDPITGDRYYCSEFAKQEQEQMWARIWHIGGREADLRAPGDWIVHNFLRESVIIARQTDGAIRAFYNSCRHRGNRLLWAEAGAGDFKCTYHGWTYGVDGVLKQAQDPEDFAGGSPCGRVSLVGLNCDSWGGFVWYTMHPDAPPLMEFLDPIPLLMKNRDLEDSVRVVHRTFNVDANWKFASDNFNESYHLPTVHPELATTTDEDYKNTKFEAYSSGHNRMIEQAQPSLRAPNPNEVEAPWDAILKEWELDPSTFAGRSRESRIPLQQQRRKLGPQRGFAHYEKLTDDELTDYFHHTLFPNVTLTGTAEGVHFFRTEPHPTDPEKCTFDYWFLAPLVKDMNSIDTICGQRPMQEAQHEFISYGAGADIPDMQGSFLLQDLGIAVGQQLGFHSRGYSDAILSGQESRVRRFHEVLNDYISTRR